MVFPTSSSSSHKIVRTIVPNNNNMSLFNELTDEYSLELQTGKSNRSEFETPVPAKRPLVKTSYVFEKELREDFDNPFCIDSSDDEEEEEVSTASSPTKLWSQSVCDSGIEDDMRGSSTSLPRERGSSTSLRRERGSSTSLPRERGSSSSLPRERGSSSSLPRERSEDEVLRDHRPAQNVQMSGVKETSEDTLDEMTSLSMRLRGHTTCASDSNIASTKLSQDASESARHCHSNGPDLPDMGQLTEGWVNSAHLMTAEQLKNWVHAMTLNCNKVNMELMAHLAERDELRELQDKLLQRIFVLKNVSQTGIQSVKPETDKQTATPSIKRRVSSFFNR